MKRIISIDSDFLIIPHYNFIALHKLKEFIKKGNTFLNTDSDDLIEAPDIIDFLHHCGWDYKAIARKVYFVGYFDGDSDLIFDLISKYVLSGSYIEIVDENEFRHRWNFINGEMITQNMGRTREYIEAFSNDDEYDDDDDDYYEDDEV